MVELPSASCPVLQALSMRAATGISNNTARWFRTVEASYQSPLAVLYSVFTSLLKNGQLMWAVLPLGPHEEIVLT